MKAITYSFDDGNGNKFLFPGLIHRPDDENSIGLSECLFRSMSISLALGLEKYERIEIDLDSDDFKYFEVSMGHSAFEHGSEDGMIYAGPLFEKTLKEVNA